MQRNHLNRASAWLAATALVATPFVLAAPAAEAVKAAKAPAYTVTANINMTTAVAGSDVVKIRGKVTPKAAGAKVVLQQRVGTKKKWSVSGASTIKKNGSYVLTDKPSTIGEREYRVLKPSGQGIKKGLSKTLKLEVYAWQKLAWTMPSGASENVSTIGATASIGTREYPGSQRPVIAGAPAFIEYTVGRRCTEMRTTYALDDLSATGSTGAIRLSVDGAVKAEQALTVGQVVESTVDLTDAFRVRFDFTSNASPASYPVVGSPEVLCTA